MFCQAGIRTTGARIWCRAFVSKIGAGGIAPARLVWWRDCGDHAWASDTQICWPHQVIVHSRFLGTWMPRQQRPCSSISERPATAPQI